MAGEEIKEVPEVLVGKIELDNFKLIIAGGYTEAELSDLSKEELEGILDSVTGGDDDKKKDGEKPPLTEEELKRIAAADETEEAKALRLKAEQEAADAKALEDEAKTKGITVEALKAEKAAAVEAAKVETSAEGAVTDEDLLDFEPVVTEEELPYDDVVSEEIQTKLTDLETKFDAGGMERAEYNKERDALNRQVVKDNIKARDAAKEELVWKKEQSFFFANKPEYRGDKGADGKYTPNLQSRALLGALREAASSMFADPKHANKRGMEVLIAADKAVKAMFGKKEAAPAAPAAPAKPAAALPDQKTLTDIPNAQQIETEGAFAALDKLTGEEYEDALAKLPEALKNRYLDDSRPRQGRV